MSAMEGGVPQNDEEPSNRHHPSNSKGQRRELTLEEKQVMRECVRNSILYRGLPCAVIGVSCLSYAARLGVIRKPSSLFYTAVAAFGFIDGMFLYRRTCRQKILALENSPLADEFRRKLGLGPPLNVELQDENTVPVDHDDDIFKSPLNKRIQDRQTWSEHPRDVSQTSNEKEISYDDLRKEENHEQTWDDVRLRNRTTRGNYKSFTPEKEANFKRKSRHLPSESSPGTRLPSILDDNESESTEINETKHVKDFPRKNKYGDNIM